MEFQWRPFRFRLHPTVVVALLFFVGIMIAFFSGNEVAARNADRLVDAAVERVLEIDSGDSSEAMR